MDSRTAFLERAALIVGAENVVVPGVDAGYIDPYPLVAGRGKWPGVRPGSVEEVREVVRLANELEVALWTFSRGKNLGSGPP